MVYLFGVIDNMRCVSHFPYLGPNYSTKKKKKVVRKYRLAMRRTGRVKYKGTPMFWLGGKIGHSRLRSPPPQIGLTFILLILIRRKFHLRALNFRPI